LLVGVGVVVNRVMMLVPVVVEVVVI